MHWPSTPQHPDVNSNLLTNLQQENKGPLLTSMTWTDSRNKNCHSTQGGAGEAQSLQGASVVLSAYYTQLPSQPALIHTTGLLWCESSSSALSAQAVILLRGSKG